VPLSTLADAYSAGAEAWASGPVRIYGLLAELLVDCSPIALRGSRVLDLGTGTGAASRPAVAKGASVTALDTAFGMLLTDRAERPPAVVGDALALPFRPGAFDLVVAAFSMNHLDDPVAGVRAVSEIIKGGGFLLASTYAVDDDHPVKAAVEQALGEHGWQRPPWYSDVKRAMAAWGTVDQATSAVDRGGMHVVSVDKREVPFPQLETDALIGWRLGMAQSAGYFASLAGPERTAVVERARELLGPHPAPLIRRVLFIVARAR
jgi:SAM-dependent methyltransferase